MARALTIPFYATLTFALVALVVTIIELPYLPDIATEYAVYRGGVIFLALVAAIRLRRNPFSLLGNSLVILCFTAYNCGGYIYRPLYLMGYIQCTYAFSFLWFTTRKQFVTLTTISIIVFLTVTQLYMDQLHYDPGDLPNSDVIITPIIANLVAILIHHFFTAERMLREMLADRFSVVGRLASTIVHDVKGGLTSPMMLVEDAKQSVEAGDFVGSMKSLKNMEESLQNLHKMVINLNELSRVSKASVAKESVMLSQVICDVESILQKRIYGIEIQLSGDIEIKGDRSLLNSIFLNLISNSLNQFQEHACDPRQIEIRVDGQSRVVYQDSGPGLSTKIVEILNRQGFAGSESLNSDNGNNGLGLVLIGEGMRSIGGKMNILPNQNGARIELIF